jgi:hypothetical protein
MIGNISDAFDRVQVQSKQGISKCLKSIHYSTWYAGAYREEKF